MARAVYRGRNDRLAVPGQAPSVISSPDHCVPRTPPGIFFPALRQSPAVRRITAPPHPGAPARRDPAFRRSAHPPAARLVHDGASQCP